MSDRKIAFVSSGVKEADEARDLFAAQYGDAGIADADIVVALGGDGLMLETLHRVMDRSIAVYGLNLGTIGFLLNEFSPDDLLKRIESAEPTTIRPLVMDAVSVNGEEHTALALNEVSLFRASYQAARIEVQIDGKTRMDELVCDGILLATPAGSTAYNLSAHGPILPINSPLLALTPISPFRPRRWRGAILPESAHVTFVMLEHEKRPVNAVADNVQFTNVTKVSVHQSTHHSATLLFDPGHSLEERVLNEQFRF